MRLLNDDCRRLVDVLVEEVEASREVAVEEARLGEAQVDLHALERARQLQPQELAVAEQVALGDATSPITPSDVE